MKSKKMLLQENPKALQYLHHAHGFDFEKPFFLGSFPGRFTYKMVSDMITANIGPEYTAALLVKPDKTKCFTELHHVTMNHGKFNIDSKPGFSGWTRFHISHFFSVGDFEETRKHKTVRVYIIAQKPEYIVTPKNTIPITSGIRYRIDEGAWRGGITRAGDGRGNSWISEIVLKTTDGKRGNVTFKPFDRFYPAERRSDDISDYIDKSGYITRYRRMELHARAVDLKRQHNAERLEKTDFSEREKKAAAEIEAVKQHFVKLAKAGNATEIYYHALNFKILIADFNEINTAKFSSVEAKNRHFDRITERAGKILNGGNK